MFFFKRGWPHMAMTPAERQRRRRAKLAAMRPAETVLTSPLEDRSTRQEAWDEATETLQDLLEGYRIWRALTPAPAGAEPRLLDLHRLAALSLTLAMVSFPLAFAEEWHFPDDPPPPKDGTGLDPRSLRGQLLAVDPAALDPDNFPRTLEDDTRALEWWSRIPLDARSTWQRMARSDDPLDVWYIVKKQFPG